ncbi:hypothetical protein EV661_2166 [Variibacter gotjawalensis]|nr:hypothetical protein EV661_2166 [Variibacter gotjawalensis]
MTVTCSNLILLLDGKVYPEYSCFAPKGIIATSSLKALLSAVLAHVLDLTIKLGTAVPGAKDISIGATPEPPRMKDLEDWDRGRN